MSESTTPSDKEVPGSLPPGEPGNRAKFDWSRLALVIPKGRLTVIEHKHCTCAYSTECCDC